MNNEELLLELTKSYLKSLISEISNSLIDDSKITTPFQELGLDSFKVLQVIKKLEDDFGSLPKTLLFENFNISDLANYFVQKYNHELTNKFNDKMRSRGQSKEIESAEIPKIIPLAKETGKAVIAPKNEVVATLDKPILILEKDALNHPELGNTVKDLYDRFKNESSVSRGTRNIAPNLFIGKQKKGYFHYSRYNNIILVYAFTGPRDYFDILAEEILHYCTDNKFELNFFNDVPMKSVGAVPFSATPFGAVQRITNLKAFTLAGNKMRRLRYQVSKFEGEGSCYTIEYKIGSDPEVAGNIANIIEMWCAPRTMVNPLIHIVKDEILNGTLHSAHRIFLTYLNNVLQNVILITKMSEEENGYLMDLEFYPPEMPLGGLEFAIVKIIETISNEGCTLLSLGGTYGVKIADSQNPDHEVEKILDTLREQKLFNDEGNLQFKNKFRTENSSIFLCRPVENCNPNNVTDIIMMIADPSKMQTSEEENQITSKDADQITGPVSEIKDSNDVLGSQKKTVCSKENSKKPALYIEELKSYKILCDYGFNPLNIPHSHVEYDLLTDSWAQLSMPAIGQYIGQLHKKLQFQVNIEENLKAIFPFNHFVLTKSGRAAEHVFFKASDRKGVVLQNMLFPTTIFNQIDNAFIPVELPCEEVFNLRSNEIYKGNLEWDLLRKKIEKKPEEIGYVCIEVNDNAAGGYSVSINHLSRIKELLSKYSIPLIIDATRIVENARTIIENENPYSQKSIWDVVREILSFADVVIASLTKNFCITSGGMVATNNPSLFQKMQTIISDEGSGLDFIDKKLIALSLQNTKYIESKVIQRMNNVRQVWSKLKSHGVPVLIPCGAHCIIIDVKQIPEFNNLHYPVESFIAWLFLNTGIRAGAHNAGMQKNSVINDTVRLAIPVGLESERIEDITLRLISLFKSKNNIPDLHIENSGSETVKGIHAKFNLQQMINMSEAGMTQAAENISKQESFKETVEKFDAHEYQTQNTGQVIEKEPQRRSKDIAIIGMAGRYPKAKNLNELWENILSGRDCIELIPDVRFEQRRSNGFTQKYRGGFIDNIDKFDSMFFNIPPRVAEQFDPQERLFLEVAWEAIEDAGYYPEILSKGKTSGNIGVFVGAVWTMYQMIGVEEKLAGFNTNPNSFLWSIANRVSYCMNFSGPSFTVDTACSSSLTALYLACEAIQNGQCKGAIVGGVNLDLHQSKFDINSTGGALSKDGVCRTFGKGANGYVAGEGVGAIFLKPLAQAIADCDNIYGVIKGIAINHGGKTSGYIVPNPHAQAQVIQTALEQAQIDARTIGYIEAHGTGTELGDPIEITGLTNAFQKFNVDKQSCAIGSIKTNIGHLEAAAGLVGVQKVLLQMKYGKLVPSLHSSELNPFIDFVNSPFYVQQNAENWEPKNIDGKQFPLRAGVSSFGAGGANANVIIERYEQSGEDKKNTQHQTSEYVFPLSARNEEQLLEAVTRLRSAVENSISDNGISESMRINDIAYTLQVGRKSFDYRLAIIATNHQELIQKLNDFLNKLQNEDVLYGSVKTNDSITRLLSNKEKEEFVRLISQSRDSRKIAQLWIEGLLTEWGGVYEHNIGKRISLPTYPFADKRHWAADLMQKSNQIMQIKNSLHPLIDSNESTFERQIFKKTFTTKEFFIYDHLVSEIPTLPGVAYLDLARKAGELATGRKVSKIRNIVWLSPLTVVKSIPTDALIELKPNRETVQFEVYSECENGKKQVYSQGSLVFSSPMEESKPSEYINLIEIQSRCAKILDGKDAYPLFKKLGLNLGPSFQVLQEVFKNDGEMLSFMMIPPVRNSDFKDFLLHPSLVDGTGQTVMAAQLASQETSGEMYVPYSFGEVEIYHPLEKRCFCYAVKVNESDSKLSKANLTVVDETGKILLKIKDSVGIPLLSVHEKSNFEKESKPIDQFTKLYYEPQWQRNDLQIKSGLQTLNSPILLFDNDDTIFNLYKERSKLVNNLPGVILVQQGPSYQDCGDNRYKINPTDEKDFIQLFESLQISNNVINRICFAWPKESFFKIQNRSEKDGILTYDGKILNESLQNYIYPFLYLSKAIVELKLESKLQLIYLYLTKQDGEQPHNDAINGFARSLQIEQSKIECKILEFRQELTDYNKIIDAVTAEFTSDTSGHMTVRYVDGMRYIRTFKDFNIEESIKLPPDHLLIKENGVYIITGGAGGLGLIFAEYLAKEYKARLVLTGRSEMSSQIEEKLKRLTDAGSEIYYTAKDISRYDDAILLVEETRSRFGQINGIIHSAGVLRDSYIKNKTYDEMASVLAPKTFGVLYLDELTKDDSLDFFVYFSSMAAVGGNIGQCDYSYANHFLDSFAFRRVQLVNGGLRNGKTLSINWSPWADGGMKLDDQTKVFFRKNLGINPLDNLTGVYAFLKGIASDKTQFAFVEGLKDKIEVSWGIKSKETAPSHGTKEPEIKTVVTNPGTVPSVSSDDVLSKIQDELIQIVVRLLKVDEEDVSTEKILLDIGFDSIGLSAYANAINEIYKLEITPVLFFEHASINAIAKHLYTAHKDTVLKVHQSPNNVKPAQNDVPITLSDSVHIHVENIQMSEFKISKGWNPDFNNQSLNSINQNAGVSLKNRFSEMPIAVVGMSGILPQSDNLEEFWEKLERGQDMITVIPRDRWKWEDYDGDPIREKNKTNSKYGGFMRNIDKFDPLFFGISPREAEMMDPQQRLFLQTVWSAIEDSGHKVSDLSGTKTGLFVGVATRDYTDLMSVENVPLDGYSASGSSHCVLANRISFLLNLRGPSAPIDTACSSSLVALHRAIESIHTGSSDMAIVGGVMAMLTPAAHISFGMAGMLSSDGKCKTFDKRANGYVRGEGVGAIFIKPLAMAEADGDNIYAVIKSTAENHGGRVTMLTAPNPNAQAELLVEAYEKAQIDPTTIGFIECHGTGTSLGDPIEIQALNKAFSELYQKHNKAPAKNPHIGLTSVKTNIGHLETAAGIAGVLKVLLSIKHKKIPALANFQEINPYINLTGSPFYIVDKTKNWEPVKSPDGKDLPRRVGVSSFGFGGANAHVVFEEYIPLVRNGADSLQRENVFVLSAKNKERLKEYAKSILNYIDKQKVDFNSLLYTLQVGRDAMEERLGIVVSSVEIIREKLADYVHDKQPLAGVYSGRVSRKSAVTQEENLDSWIANRDFHKIAEAWVKGCSVEWTTIYNYGMVQRVNLPSYPFAQERYWFHANPVSKGFHNSTAALHPLLHRNTSTLVQQCFSSSFNGKEFFLSDHLVNGYKNIPYSALLEMARAAVELALPEFEKVDVINLQNIDFFEMDGINDSLHLSTALFRNEDEGIEFEIYNSEIDAVYCKGSASFNKSGQNEKIDLDLLKQLCSKSVIEPGFLKNCVEKMGISYGASFEAIKTIYQGDSQQFIELCLPKDIENNFNNFHVHPSMMESCFQAALGLVTQYNPLQGKPASISALKSLKIAFACTQEMCAWIRYTRGSKIDDQLSRIDIDLMDMQGRVCVKLKSLEIKYNKFEIDNRPEIKMFELLLDKLKGVNVVDREIIKTDSYNHTFKQILDTIQ